MTETSELQNTNGKKTAPRTVVIIVVAVFVQVVFIGLGLWWWFFQAEYGANRDRLLVREVLIPEELVFADTEVGITIGERTPPIDVVAAIRVTPEKIQAGQNLYAEHCATCHGESGAGDGPSGRTLVPPPRNLRTLHGWVRGTSLADIFTTTSIGLEGTAMSAFDYLTPEERFNITHYVMSLSDGHARTTPAMLDSLDARFSLSEGQQQPNIIPLSMATEKLIGEAVTAPPTPDEAQQAELRQREPRGAELYETLVFADARDRVAYWLYVDMRWQTSPDRLRDIAVAGSPSNGFAPRVRTLSAEDWDSLHRYLRLKYQANS